MNRVRMRTRRVVSGACAAALLLTGCAGDGDDAAVPSTTPTATTTTDTATTPTPTPTAGDDVPAPGTTFAGESIDSERAAELQMEVDQGHEPWRLDQSSVAAMFAGERFGWTDVEIALDDPHTVQVTDPDTQHVVSLQLRQPATEGDTGIWVVDSGVWLA